MRPTSSNVSKAGKSDATLLLSLCPFFSSLLPLSPPYSRLSPVSDAGVQLSCAARVAPPVPSRRMRAPSSSKGHTARRVLPSPALARSPLASLSSAPSAPFSTRQPAARQPPLAWALHRRRAGGRGSAVLFLRLCLKMCVAALLLFLPRSSPARGVPRPASRSATRRTYRHCLR